MNFKEKHLVAILEKTLQKEFGTNYAFRELSAGYGIADLVFAEDYSFSQRNAPRRPAITNYVALQIFISMQQHSNYTLQELTQLCTGLKGSELKRHLQALERDGYILNLNGSYSKIIDDSKFNPIKKVIAIEAKLTDHRNGLIQARRYQYFADESYLAILKGTIKEADINEFKTYNIGLILFDKDTETVEIFHPHSQSSLMQNNLNLFAREIMLDSFSKSISLAR